MNRALNTRNEIQLPNENINQLMNELFSTQLAFLKSAEIYKKQEQNEIQSNEIIKQLKEENMKLVKELKDANNNEQLAHNHLKIEQERCNTLNEALCRIQDSFDTLSLVKLELESQIDAYKSKYIDETRVSELLRANCECLEKAKMLLLNENAFQKDQIHDLNIRLNEMISNSYEQQLSKQKAESNAIINRLNDESNILKNENEIIKRENKDLKELFKKNEDLNEQLKKNKEDYDYLKNKLVQINDPVNDVQKPENDTNRHVIDKYKIDSGRKRKKNAQSNRTKKSKNLSIVSTIKPRSNSFASNNHESNLMTPEYRIRLKCLGDIKSLAYKKYNKKGFTAAKNLITTQMFKEMVYKMPCTKEELLKIHNFSEDIYKNFDGDEFLLIFRVYAKQIKELC